MRIAWKKLVERAIDALLDASGCNRCHAQWADNLKRTENSRDYLADECRRLRGELHYWKGVIQRYGDAMEGQYAAINDLKRQLKNANRREKRWRLKCGA